MPLSFNILFVSHCDFYAVINYLKMNRYKEKISLENRHIAMTVRKYVINSDIFIFYLIYMQEYIGLTVIRQLYVKYVLLIIVLF